MFGDEDVQLGNLLADDAAPRTDAMAIRRNLQQVTDEMLKALTPRDEAIIRLRLGLNPAE